MRFILILFLFYLFVLPANARPVSYPDGWTLMTENNVDRNAVLLHYSPSAYYSIGLRHEYLRQSEAHADMMQVNALLKRWNMPQSQANLYLKSGFGVAYEDDLKPAAFTGIAADWEDRRLFTSYENHFFWSDDIDQHAKHEARIGVAPYEGDYGDVHTWIMLQADYDAGLQDSFSLTPLVRFFKGADLLEAGYNLDGGGLFNYVHRF